MLISHKTKIDINLVHLFLKIMKYFIKLHQLFLLTNYPLLLQRHEHRQKLPRIYFLIWNQYWK